MLMLDNLCMLWMDMNSPSNCWHRCWKSAEFFSHMGMVVSHAPLLCWSFSLLWSLPPSGAGVVHD